MLSEKLTGRLRRVRRLSSSLGSPFLNPSLNGIVVSSAISTSTISLYLCSPIDSLFLQFVVSIDPYLFGSESF